MQLSPEQLAELYLQQQGEADDLALKLADATADAADAVKTNPVVKRGSKKYEVTVPSFKVRIKDEFHKLTAADLVKTPEYIDEILKIEGQAVLKAV